MGGGLPGYTAPGATVAPLSLAPPAPARPPANRAKAVAPPDGAWGRAGKQRAVTATSDRLPG